MMIYRLILLVFCLFFFFPLPAHALTPPPPSDPSQEMDTITFICEASPYYGSTVSRIQYFPADDSGLQDFSESQPDESFCDFVIDGVSSSSSGDDISVPQETLGWWQATIDFMLVSVSIGSRIYPVILGIRVISLIAYS